MEKIFCNSHYGHYGVRKKYWPDYITIKTFDIHTNKFKETQIKGKDLLNKDILDAQKVEANLILSDEFLNSLYITADGLYSSYITGFHIEIINILKTQNYQLLGQYAKILKKHINATNDDDNFKLFMELLDTD